LKGGTSGCESGNEANNQYTVTGQKYIVRAYVAPQVACI